MPGYATLPIMGAEDFRADLRRRRSAQRLSRAALAQRSGVSAPTIEKIEMGKSHPERETVIDLTRALNCDIDEALGAVGYEPLTEEERAGLGRINSPLEQLDRMLRAAAVAGLRVPGDGPLDPQPTGPTAGRRRPRQHRRATPGARPRGPQRLRRLSRRPDAQRARAGTRTAHRRRQYLSAPLSRSAFPLRRPAVDTSSPDPDRRRRID